MALSTRQADPFSCQPLWQFTFHEAFSPDRRLIIRESSNNVIAFAEKKFSASSIFLTPIEPLWFFGNPLLGNQAVELFSDSLEGIERYYSPVFPKIVISGIRPNGVLFKTLTALLGGRLDFAPYRAGIQCAASLDGGIDGHLSRRSRNFRRKLTKQNNRAAGTGISFERRTPSSNIEAEKVYARMLSIELSSWKGVGRCGMDQPRPKEFYSILLRRLAASQNARVIFARHEGEDVGFIFGGMANGTYRGQQFSFDEKWRASSIGNILQMEQVKWACEEGATRYDMGPLLGDRMGYKSHWTESHRNIEAWVLSKK